MNSLQRGHNGTHLSFLDLALVDDVRTVFICDYDNSKRSIVYIPVTKGHAALVGGACVQCLICPRILYLLPTITPKNTICLCRFDDHE